jgi:hypothetical protein
VRRGRRPSLSLPRPRLWPATSGPGPQRRWRGLLVTPWFAAGAGFVIAAGLALNSPHTVLTYRPKTQPCQHGCEQPVPSGGSAAVVTPGVRIKSPKPVVHPHRRLVRPTHGSRAGALVGFKVMWQQPGRFGAFITIPARQARHAWSLSFDIPGTKIVQVWGALWQPAADGRGGLARRSALPGQLDGNGGQGHDGSHGAHAAIVLQRAHISRGGGFIVIVEGDPAAPAGCVLNGHACHFG